MKQVMINEINGILTYMDPKDKKKLPSNFVSYFKQNACIMPEKSIDPEKPLYEQKLDDQTILMLAYINKLLKKSA